MTTSTDWRAFFSGRFLTGPDCEGEPTYRIRAVKAESIENPDDNTVRRKMVVHFDNPDSKPWIPCKTTATCLAAMFGDDVGAWVGKPVTLWYDRAVKVGRETKGGVRVKGSPAIDRPLKVVVKLPRRRPLELTMQPTGRPQQDRQRGAQHAADPLAVLGAALSRHGLTVANLDHYRASEGKSPVRELSPEQVSRLANYLSGDKGAGMIEAIKAVANG